ncbi:MAG: hypothetical protein WBE96_06565, partial [Pseudolabrys sp.]
ARSRRHCPRTRWYFPACKGGVAPAMMSPVVQLAFALEHEPPGAESFNNVLALAFGVLIVFLLIVGSLWIMTHLNHNMVSMEQLMQMQR